MFQKWLRLIGILVTTIFFYGCETTLYVKKGDYLLDNTPTIRGNTTFSKEYLQEGIMTKANRRVLGFKVYLIAWNIGMFLAKEKDFKPRKYYQKIDKNERYLRNIAWWLVKIIGEPPALLDTIQLKKDADNLAQILQSHGYLNAKVDYKTEKIFSKIKLINGVEKIIASPKILNAYFVVQENEPFLLRKISILTKDTLLEKILTENFENSYLKPGDIYQELNFEKERLRIANILRNHGYFKFSPGLIAYEVDTTGQINKRIFQNLLRKTSVVPVPNQPLYADISIIIDSDEQFVYQIKNVNVYLKTSSTQENTDFIRVKNPDFDDNARSLFRIPKKFFDKKNPTIFHLPVNEMKTLNLNFLNNQITLKQNDTYQLQKLLTTQQRLQNLGVFRSVFINYSVDDSNKTITPNINLTLVQRNSFQTGFEVFQSENRSLNSNLPGIGGRLSYSHRNFLKRADKLEFSVSGNISFYIPDSSSEVPRTFFQFLPKLSFIFPRILFFEKLFSNPYEIRPSTRLVWTFTSENRIEFNRTALGVNFSYIWHSSKSQKFRYQFTLLDFNLIDSKNLSPGFLAQIASLPPTTQQLIRRDFTPRYNSKFGFRVFYNTYQKEQRKISIASVLNAEIGGNIPFLLEKIGFLDKKDSSLTDGYVNNQFLYGQFYKLFHDSKLYIPTTKNGVLILRMMQGISFGFNRTKIVPFENRYFSGGISSVRGWQSNTLGPGIFVKSENNLLVYGGEIAIEGNVELRQKVYKYLETAIFCDAGNVWFSKNGGFQDSDGKFGTNTLKFGVAAGIGFRFDFTFLIIRLDFGQQIYDPSRQDFVFKKIKDIGGKNLQYNLGIGYPF